MSIDDLETAINDISDRDHSWWPFLWLRPEPDAHLSLGRVVSLSVLYGVPCSVLMMVALACFGPAERSALVATAFSFPLLCLFFGSVVMAPMWNRRADRLRARRAARSSAAPAG